MDLLSASLVDLPDELGPGAEGEQTQSDISSLESSNEDLEGAKRARYSCQFHPESNKFKWAKASSKGSSYARCTACNRDVSIAYGGTKDLRRHEQTAVHQTAQKSSSGVTSLASYFNKSGPGPHRDKAVVEAEVKFGFFLGEHHVAFTVADHCSKLLLSLFPDSPIAKAFKCGRTKATGIVKIIAQEVMQDILCRLKDSKFFSIQTDETTDITVLQQCGIMLRFFDNISEKVRRVFYKLEPVEAASAEGLFQLLDSNFSDEGPLTYDNLVGMGSDGANVMLGSRNSVLSRLKTKQSNLISFHCNCHVAALIANYACKEMPDYLDDLTIQIWYFFQKSPKRQRVFEEFQEFVNCKPHKLLKAGQTRWLSLEACVNRLLEQYDALLSYFQSTSETQMTVQRITSGLENPFSRAYLMFLSDALPVINIFNKMMQRQAPAIHCLQQEVHSFIKKLLLRFMLPEVIATSQLSVEVGDTTLYKPLEEVFVGEKAQMYLEESDLSTNEIRQFHETCRRFWIAAVTYALKKLPVTSSFLNNLGWIYPRIHDYGKENQVLAVATCLPQVIKEDQRAKLREDFMDYCTSQLPPTFSEEVDAMEVDNYWHKVSLLKDISGDIQYPLLTKLAKAVLIIPHGNADIERMFSHMGLNKTKIRNCLGTETLTALLRLQFNVKEPCYSFKPTKQVLERCRNVMSSLSHSE